MRTAGVRRMPMRGGTSKGACFLAEDLPQPRKLFDGTVFPRMGFPRSSGKAGAADGITAA